MTNKLFIIMYLFLFISVLSGCSFTEESENSTENQQLACVEIYDLDKQTLLSTIEDAELLKTFNENTEEWSDMDDKYMDTQSNLQKQLENYDPQYTFTAYKAPVALINDGTLETMFEITIYKDTNIIKFQIAPGNVKNASVPSEYLTFYFEASEDVMTYLYSLV